VFTPVFVNGRMLVDGGCNPLPVDPTAAVTADLTVAVSLASPRSSDLATPAKDPSATSRHGELITRVRAIATRSRRGGESSEPLPSAAPRDPRVGDVLIRSVDAMQALITRYRTATLPPDVLVSIPIDACGTLDFHRAGERIQLGREATALVLDRHDGIALTA
jgi:NTE family protein